ncbi:MAG: acyl carrier protein [Clostridiales bacterium]|jgi:acyl carrier protein|nr:acyl carrier protein [Clostridiales bacterium]
MDDREKLNEIFREVSAVEEPITEEMDLQMDLGWDSLRMVEVIVKIEETFDREFDESDLNPDQLQTVGDMYRLLEI